MFLQKVIVFIAVCLATASIGLCKSKEDVAATENIVFENEYVEYRFGTDGMNAGFIDKRTGKDYCADRPASRFAWLTKDGKQYGVSAVSYANGRMTVQFGDLEVKAVIQVTSKKHYLVFKVVSVSDKHVEELVFMDIPLTCQAIKGEAFSGCALALNLQTMVKELPGPNRLLRAACYPRFGFAGAKVAIIGCPSSELRNVMKEVVLAAEEIPRSPLAGPWAPDAPINRDSYLSGNPTEKTVDSWINLARDLGINQIKFGAFRYGDYLPNRKIYPNGWESVKKVVDKIHAAGLKAGVHTMSFFIDKSCKLVTPIPDPRLGKDATFTLAEALSPEDAVVPVIVDTTVTSAAKSGFFARNYMNDSKTIQIDDELITYSGVGKEPPYTFTACRRGVCGTKVASHAKGAKVHHLKRRLGVGYFIADGDSTLFTEVAAKIAEIANYCGFDMIYLDGLDREGVLAGMEYRWHYETAKK